MQRKNVGILRGGRDPWFDLSIKSGEFVRRSLDKLDFNINDIWISKDGIWHKRGFEVLPVKALEQLDTVLNVLPLETYADIQRDLERISVPYVGPASVQALLAVNRNLTREILASEINFPKSRTLSISENFEDELYNIFKSVPQPVVVKPAQGFLGDKENKPTHGFFELKDSISDAFESFPKVLLEEYIRGRYASCLVIDNFRGEELYIFPPLEFQESGDENYYFYSSNFTSEEKKELERVSLEVHRDLGLKHCSKMDFVVSPKRGVFLLEIDPLPLFSSPSAFGIALESVGSSIDEFLKHIIDITT